MARRFPRAQVTFIGERTNIVSPEALVSVSTSKALSSSAGAFSIMLRSAPSPMAMHGTPLVPNSDYWLKNVHPMTMVQIALGTDSELAEVSRVTAKVFDAGQELTTDLLKRESTETIRRAVVMLGLVDTVSLSTEMTEDGPQRFVRITGRDMGKVLTDDYIRVVMSRLPRGTEDNDGPGIAYIGSPERRQAFVERIQIEQSDAWYSLILRKGFVPMRETFSKLLEIAPAFQTSLPDGRTLRQFFPEPQIDDDVAQFSVEGASFALFFQGSIWQAMSSLAPRPVTEVFTDTVGFMTQAIVRRPPFWRDAANPDALGYADRVLGKGNVRATERRRLLRVPFSPHVDAFTETPLRVVNTEPGHAYHTVEAADLVKFEASKSDQDVFSQYQVIPSLFLRGASSSVLNMDVGAFAVPSILDVSAATRYGVRHLQVSLPWYPNYGITPSDENPTEADIRTMMGIAGKEAIRAYYFFRDNAEFLSGHLVMKGRADIRIGDRLLLPSEGDLLLYVEKVAHNYTVGRPFTTLVSFSRGQPKALSARLSPIDPQDPPALG